MPAISSLLSIGAFGVGSESADDDVPVDVHHRRVDIEFRPIQNQIALSGVEYQNLSLIRLDVLALLLRARSEPAGSANSLHLWLCRCVGHR